jgi:hypothetical protein
MSLSGFLVGFFSGVLSSAFVAYFVELGTRWRLHGEAKRLKGEWIAHDMLDARTVDRSKPMKDTWPTVMTPKRYGWAANSHVLDISGDHTSNDGTLRHMEGYLTIDRVSPRLATRIVYYTDSDEVNEQRIVISSDGQTLHVFPVVPLSQPTISYNRHALCRRPE